MNTRLPTTPNHASDETISKLFDLATAITRKHAEALQADPTLAARLDADPALVAEHASRLFREIDLTRRAYDIHAEYNSSAPRHMQFQAIDWNSYDGAPDSQAPSTFIGYGVTDAAAKKDLIEQFAVWDEEHPETQKPRASRVIGLGHPEQPPEYVDDDVDGDDRE